MREKVYKNTPNQAPGKNGYMIYKKKKTDTLASFFFNFSGK